MRTALKLLNPRLRFEAADPGMFERCVAVIAAPFNSYVPGDTPDASNKAIAEMATLYCGMYKLPFFGQWEQTLLLRSKGIETFDIPPEHSDWIKTHILMKWVAGEVVRRTQKKEVILIGHPHHVRRVGILAEHYGLVPHIPITCINVHYDPSDRPGAQWWCRSAPNYLLWEYGLARPKLVLDDLRGVL